MHIAIVIPVYNEENGIEEFFRRTSAVLKTLPHAFSFVAVNDGSRDGTLQKLLALKNASSFPLTVIELSRNFGHGNALTAGIDHANGDAVILMDADLEDPPEIIPQLIAEFENGKDVVYTVKTRREDTFLRRIAFTAFHATFARVTNLDIPEGSGSYCLLSKRFVEQFRRLQESNRFIPGLRAFVGFSPGYVSYAKEKRFAGVPKQTFSRLLDLALNAFFLFSNAPVKTSTVLWILGTIVAIAALFTPAESALRSSGLLILGALLLTQLWIIAIIVAKTHGETLRRPPYIVKKIHD